MKVYEGMSGTQIKFKPNLWAKGTEFMVQEEDNCIRLIKIGMEE